MFLSCLGEKKIIQIAGPSVPKGRNQITSTIHFVHSILFVGSLLTWINTLSPKTKGSAFEVTYICVLLYVYGCFVSMRICVLCAYCPWG